jgi:sensor c-di-GMP phosphodiesterase-like protein
MSKLAVISEIFAAVGAAIDAENKAKGKWVALKVPVAKYYATREGFVAVRAQFITDYILPNMGKDETTGLSCVDLMAKELPRKNTKEYNQNVAADAGYEKEHASLRAARVIVNAKAGEYCTRVENYTFGSVEKPADSNPQAPETKQAKLLKAVSALLEKVQKDEAPTYNHKEVVRGLQIAAKGLA